MWSDRTGRQAASKRRWSASGRWHLSALHLSAHKAGRLLRPEWTGLGSHPHPNKGWGPSCSVQAVSLLTHSASVHLSVDVHHVRRLQPHMEVQAQLATEAVQGAQRAAGQQHTARNMRQAPAGAHHAAARHSAAQSGTGVALKPTSGNLEPHSNSTVSCIRNPQCCMCTAHTVVCSTPPPTHTHLKTTAGLRHHRQNLNAHEVVATPVVSANPSVLGSGRRRSRRPL